MEKQRKLKVLKGEGDVQKEPNPDFEEYQTPRRDINQTISDTSVVQLHRRKSSEMVSPYHDNIEDEEEKKLPAESICSPSPLGILSRRPASHSRNQSTFSAYEHRGIHHERASTHMSEQELVAHMSIRTNRNPHLSKAPPYHIGKVESINSIGLGQSRLDSDRSNENPN